MRRRTVSLALALAAVALGVLVASAAALTPPAGTPNLALMTIQPSDLAAGAKPVLSAYATAPKNFAAAYDRNYASAKTSSGVALFGLNSQVLLAKTEGAAKGYFALERSIYRSKSGRRLLAKAIAQSSFNKGVAITVVGFGAFRSLGVGTQSLLQTMTLKVRGVRATADFIVLRVGSVVTSVTLLLINSKRSLAVAKQLAGDVADHIAAVLSPTGPTGTTGASGTTGTSGTTGATG
ncbi:MAG TPA: hypothetical protein VGG41_21370 [Solirubrobacteraceae bacterium]|jgi:hypothetical protein